MVSYRWNFLIAYTVLVMTTRTVSQIFGCILVYEKNVAIDCTAYQWGRFLEFPKRPIKRHIFVADFSPLVVWTSSMWLTAFQIYPKNLPAKRILTRSDWLMIAFVSSFSFFSNAFSRAFTFSILSTMLRLKPSWPIEVGGSQKEGFLKFLSLLGARLIEDRRQKRKEALNVEDRKIKENIRKKVEMIRATHQRVQGEVYQRRRKNHKYSMTKNYVLLRTSRFKFSFQCWIPAIITYLMMWASATTFHFCPKSRKIMTPS